MARFCSTSAAHLYFVWRVPAPGCTGVTGRHRIFANTAAGPSRRRGAACQVTSAHLGATQLQVTHSGVVPAHLGAPSGRGTRRSRVGSHDVQQNSDKMARFCSTSAAHLYFVWRVPAPGCTGVTGRHRIFANTAAGPSRRRGAACQVTSAHLGATQLQVTHSGVVPAHLGAPSGRGTRRSRVGSHDVQQNSDKMARFCSTSAAHLYFVWRVPAPGCTGLPAGIESSPALLLARLGAGAQLVRSPQPTSAANSARPSSKPRTLA